MAGLICSLLSAFASFVAVLALPSFALSSFIDFVSFGSFAMNVALDISGCAFVNGAGAADFEFAGLLCIMVPAALPINLAGAAGGRIFFSVLAGKRLNGFFAATAFTAVF